jgi:hypothetical protein
MSEQSQSAAAQPQTPQIPQANLALIAKVRGMLEAAGAASCRP